MIYEETIPRSVPSRCNPCIALCPERGADASIRQGKLKNGLTYYIRHNDKEAGLADFYIAQRVGSILEEPRQRGLAHFLEHMAFNGTKHFPGRARNSASCLGARPSA